MGGGGFGSPIRWATPVVCTEHGPLKCTLTFIRISLTPIMGESARLEEENCDLQWSQSPHNASRRVVRVSFLSARRCKMEYKQVLFVGACPYCLSGRVQEYQSKVTCAHKWEVYSHIPHFQFFIFHPGLQSSSRTSLIIQTESNCRNCGFSKIHVGKVAKTKWQ